LLATACAEWCGLGFASSPLALLELLDEVDRGLGDRDHHES
jgi:hypothetical protein